MHVYTVGIMYMNMGILIYGMCLCMYVYILGTRVCVSMVLCKFVCVALCVSIHVYKYE